MSFPITGIALISPLGRGPATHRRAALAPPPPTTPLGALLEQPDAAWAGLPCRPLPEEIRSNLGSSLIAPASALALWLARDCLADAGRRLDELAGPRTGLFLASSRGNLAGWINPWPNRRARTALAASNSSHAELTSALQRELKLEGPVHLGAEGCAAGLSALALAHLYLKAGEIDRALVVALDLPLSASVIRAYQQTGILGRGSSRPFAPDADGMTPAEGGAALLLERAPPGTGSPHPTLEASLVRHEGHHLLHSDPEAQRLGGWLGELLDAGAGADWLLCPHASGTASNRRTEERLCSNLEGAEPTASIAYWVPRPWTGHSIGATGLIDLALAVQFLRNGQLPPCHRDPAHSCHDARPRPIERDILLLNWSLGIGGQFAACRVRSPRRPAQPGTRLEFSVSQRELTILASNGSELARLPCTSAAKGIGFVEGSNQTPTGRFEVREKYGHAAAERTVFQSRRPSGAWTDDDAQGSRVTHGILRLHGLDEANANTWDRYIYIHGTNQLASPPENRSHGCLTLAECDFRTLFQLVPEGALLTIEA